MDALTTWPTSLLPALRLVWSRTVFRGVSITPERSTARSLLLLLALPAVLLYPCLQFRLLDPDEGRYAEIPREMLLAGDWVVPRLQGEPYLDKPPLLYWLVMLSYQVFGVHDWAARIPSALAVHATILAVYVFGCRMFGERRALRAALLLCVMPGLIGIGRLLTLDGLLTLWVTLGLLAGYRCHQPRRPRGMFALWTIATGLGVLTKGPIAVVLIVAPLLLWRWLSGSLPPCGRRLGWGVAARHGDSDDPLPQPSPARGEGAKPQINRGDWLLFGLGILAINLPWYIAICLCEPAFARYFFWQHNLQRFVTPFDHVQPIWYYAPILLGCLFPAVLWFMPVLRGLISGRRDLALRRTRELSFCCLAAGFCVVFFSLSGSKLPTYILPALPMAALALGVLLEKDQRLFTRKQWLVGVAWLVVMLAGHWLVLPAYAHHRSPMRDEEIVRRHCGDRATPVVCYPRPCNSASFYLERDDLESTRTKNIGDLINECYRRPRTVVLFTHRHSQEAFAQALPPQLNMRLSPLADFRGPDHGDIMSRVLGGGPWGLCAIAAVEHRESSP